MKKTSRANKEKGIVASVRKEMDKPRLTESVRQALSGHAAVAVEKPAAGELRLNTNHKPLKTRRRPLAAAHPCPEQSPKQSGDPVLE